jgi:hypothetical protein
MATQLKQTDFAYTPAPPPRPNIRVAFIAGKATTAVHDAMAKLPAETRDGTLEDLVWDQGVADPADVQILQSMTCSLIEAARELLSPAMYTAFLRWGETASHACSFYTSDDDGDARCAATAEARGLVSDITAENVHDLLFTTLLACIETADAPAFGPFDRKYGEFDVNGGDLLAGLSRDLRKFSPIPDLVNELSSRAWKASKCRLAISAEVGRAITSAFSFARGEDSVGRDDLALAAGQHDGLAEWQRAHATFRQAEDAMNAYDRDHMMPVIGDYPEGMQEHYDDLVDVCYEARVALYRTPAPSAAELAIKLDLFARDDDKALVVADEIIRHLASDAKRVDSSAPVSFAAEEGALRAGLETDTTLLAAFARRRHEFETADKGPWTAEKEDAYFARVDAAEMVLLDTRATTLEGAIAKLRVAFMNQDCGDWSDLAISNTADPKFVEGLRMSGMYERMAWGAIEDLARIAGVSLVEQGA